MFKLSFWRIPALIILLFLLSLLCYLLFSIYKSSQYYNSSDNNIINNRQKNNFINHYSIFRKNKKQTQQSQQLKSYVNFKQNDKYLQVEEHYQYKYQMEQSNDQILYQNTVSKVLKVNNNNKLNNQLQLNKEQNKITYFITYSDQFQQILYHNKNDQNQLNNKYKQLKICLSLEQIQIDKKVHYFSDLNNYIWIISHPHNNIIMIQIYDCLQNKLIAKIIHQPNDLYKKYMINKFIKITQVMKSNKKAQQKSNQAEYQVIFLTYQTHQYILSIKYTQQYSYNIANNYLQYAYELTEQQIMLQKSLTNHNLLNSNKKSLKYVFFDPSNNILKQQFQLLLLQNAKKYINQIKSLLKAFNINVKWLTTYLNSRIKQLKIGYKQIQLFEYDVDVVDKQNNCLFNLKYNLTKGNNTVLQTKQQSNKILLYDNGSSSLIKLEKYLINSRTIVFHSIQNYQSFDIVQILKKQISPPLHQFKRLDIQQGYIQQYQTDYFYGLYPVYPNNNLHFMGIGQKLLNFHPSDGLKKEQYYHVRSKQGGVIFQGGKIKGAYENRPRTQNQIPQKYYIQANQVLQQVYEAHISYKTLYVQVKKNRIELIHGLNGKSLMTHYFNHKQNYFYAGSYLFNNELWVIEHNYQIGCSYMIKYELYVDSKHPKQLVNVRRVYGKIQNPQLMQEEDDLRKILQNFIEKYNKGFVILRIFRCIDQFYYIEIISTDNKIHLLVRIHFKRLSNRQPKIDGKYSGNLQQALIVNHNQMIKQKQPIHPFAVVIEDFQPLKYFKYLTDNKKVEQWETYQINQQLKIQYLQKVHQFDMLPYSVYSFEEKQNKQQSKILSQQNIYLLNMRDIIEKAYRFEITDSKNKSINGAMLLIGTLILTLIALTFKIILSFRTKNSKIQREKQKQFTSDKPKNKNKNEKQKKKAQ